jgi:hypothetical protein
LISNDTRSPGSVLMASYLNGYDRVAASCPGRSCHRRFRERPVPLHRDFVGDDAMAVYLKDVLLEIDTPGIGEGVEIADCQGSDSPNPLHLAMIQDYLMHGPSHGLCHQQPHGAPSGGHPVFDHDTQNGNPGTVVFVVNCDFSEHESLQDLADGNSQN